MNYQHANTNALRHSCYALRAQEYARYYSNIPEECYFDSVDTETLSENQLLSTTIFIQHDNEIIATARLAFVNHPNRTSLMGETSQLLGFNDTSIEHLYNITGVARSSLIGEIGKLAVSANYRSPEVVRYLLRGIGELAVGLNIGLLIALMIPHVAAVVKHAGVNHQPASNMSLDRSNPENLHYLFNFHEYFLPTLHREYPEATYKDYWSQQPLSRLEEIARGHKDGPKLYWITTDNMMECTNAVMETV